MGDSIQTELHNHKPAADRVKMEKSKIDDIPSNPI